MVFPGKIYTYTYLNNVIFKQCYLTMKTLFHLVTTNSLEPLSLAMKYADADVINKAFNK